MKPETLLNWGELSRLLSGSRMSIRANRIPKKHRELINELIDAINRVFENHKNKQDHEKTN